MMDEEKRMRLTKSKEDDKQPDVKQKTGKEDVKEKMGKEKAIEGGHGDNVKLSKPCKPRFEGEYFS